MSTNDTQTTTGELNANQPRTRAPTVPFDGRIERFLGHRDDVDDQPACPDCGGECRDLWADEGVTCLRFRCPDCSATWEPEADR